MLHLRRDTQYPASEKHETTVYILVPIKIGTKAVQEVPPFFDVFAEKNVRFYDFTS